ncbi:MAG: XylR family transcriptional regulator [Pirellula sp.]|nr:XylR family transcriptional regulator [Pirellula sp.]
MDRREAWSTRPDHHICRVQLVSQPAIAAFAPEIAQRAIVDRRAGGYSEEHERRSPLGFSSRNRDNMPADMPHVAVWIETSRGYGRGLIRGVAAYARQHGPWSIYFTPHGLSEPFSNWLSKWRGDGILARIDDQRMAKLFLAKKLPLIDLRGRLPGLKIPVVGLDNRPVAKLAFEHLRERGFRNFGFCGVPVGEHVHLDQRREFFAERVVAAGFECRIFDARKNATVGQDQKQLQSWVRSLPKPIGIMSCNDDRGQQLLNACRQIETAVPDQVAVVGVDNDEELCNLSTPALSSVDVNAERNGFVASGLLAGMMSGKKPFPGREVLFPPSHVVTRLSTDTFAVDDPSVARALRFIREHAASAIGVDEVVRAALTSRRKLERQFEALLKRSPNQEILRVRIERARSLLLETNIALAAVARQSGFSSVKYFGDAFRRQTGSSPGEFRRKSREPGNLS